MADRFAVVHRGETGFGIGMSSENYITKLSGLNSEVLEVGEQVVSVDGEELAEGQLVGDFIRAHPRAQYTLCLLYTSPSPRDRTRSRMPSSA